MSTESIDVRATMKLLSAQLRNQQAYSVLLDNIDNAMGELIDAASQVVNETGDGGIAIPSITSTNRLRNALARVGGAK